MKTSRNLLILAIILVMSVSNLSANSLSTEPVENDQTEPLDINIIQQNQEEVRGHLINADESYFVFENVADASVQLIPRTNVQLLETNMDVNLFSLLKGKDPKSLTDIIELNDGTRIPSIILDVSSDHIQYFTGKSLKREVVSADNIYMLYMDNATISIPFPMIAPDSPVL